MEEDAYFLTLLRYVEANPLRAHLANRAYEWPWSSNAMRNSDWASLFSVWPTPRPADWNELVEARWKDHELDEIRASLARDRPFGHRPWVDAIANRLGLEFTLRPRGGQKNAKNGISSKCI